MIFPWHTDLFQPGRMACVVFRASPLIWPTLFGAHHAPRPLYKVHPRWFSARGYGRTLKSLRAIFSRFTLS